MLKFPLVTSDPFPDGSDVGLTLDGPERVSHFHVILGKLRRFNDESHKEETSCMKLVSCNKFYLNLLINTRRNFRFSLW
jgi:hypothetical protein